MTSAVKGGMSRWSEAPPDIAPGLHIRTGRSEPATDDTEEELEAVPFQRVAFWMGILIILCAAALKYLHF